MQASMLVMFYRVWESCVLVLSTKPFLLGLQSRWKCLFLVLHQPPMFWRVQESRHVLSSAFSSYYLHVLCWTAAACVLESRATLDLVHCDDWWVLNSFSISTKSYAAERQIMLWAEREAERHANKERADASISGDQGSSAVGKQIRAEL